MKLLKWMTAATLIAAGATRLDGQSAPIDFHGILPGADFASVRQTFPKIGCRVPERDDYAAVDSICGPDIDRKGRRTLSSPGTYAGVDLGELRLLQWHGRFVGVELTFRSSDVMHVVDALRERWGAPTSATTDTVRTTLGASLPRTVLEWKSGDATVTSIPYTLSVDDSGLQILWNPYVAADSLRAAQDRKRRARDM